MCFNPQAGSCISRAGFDDDERFAHLSMLPTFRYHPDPIATGSVKVSDAVCRCCEQTRGYIYAASVYARDSRRDSICPWCIADGSAARKLEAMFSDDDPLAQAGVPDEVI